MPLRPPRLLAAALTALLLAATALPARAQDRVTLLIWEEFLSPKVVKTLKNRHGIEVEQLTFTSGDERDALLKKHAGRIDLVVADTTGLGDYRRRGLLEPVDAKRIPNLKRVLSRFQDDQGYAVPYLWGHTGIAWRTDLVKEPLRDYAGLFALAAKHPGKVSLLDDAHEALRAALWAVGKGTQELKTPVQVKAAAAVLAPVQSRFRFVGSELGEDNPLVTGEVIAAQAYNGDIAFLRDTYQVPLAFAVPSPGCMIWQESFLLLKGAPHRDAAYRFLNAINDATLAARNASDVRYATSNALAVSNLDPAFRADPIIRPTLDGLEGCFFYHPFDAPTQSALEKVPLGTR